MMRWSLVGLTAVGLLGAAVAHGQQTPSDASIAQLQKNTLSQTNAAQQIADRVVQHTYFLVQRVVDELENSGVSFKDMTGNSAPNTELMAVAQYGTGVKYAGKSNEVAYGSSPADMAFVFSPTGGHDVTTKMTLNDDATSCTVAVEVDMGGDYVGGTEAAVDCAGYIAGNSDDKVKSTLKQGVVDSLKGAVPQQAAANTGDSSASPNNASPQDSTILTLSGADRDAIGNHVRPCWTIDAGAPGVSDFRVELTVTTDASGTVREATVASEDQGKLSDPLFYAYAQRAIAAVENYQCATLPLPAYDLGKLQTFTFEFSPPQ
jgi:hypothetical protein